MVLVLPVAVASAVAARAQGVQTPRPERKATTRPGGPGDTIPARPAGRRDTTTRDTIARQRRLVDWVEADSETTMLLQRAGYTVTRYQGSNVSFDATGHAITLRGSAAVARDESLIVGDTLIYNDSTKVVRALGDTVVLRDPSQGQADVMARGSLTYDIERRRGLVTNVATTTETGGNTWYVRGDRAGIAGDTSGRQQTAFYARNGSLTTCDDTVPDYHFEAHEVKVVAKNILVARPAVLYVADVPVMWLPFVFQDLRSGRRSGVIPPRFGISELVRNSPNYRRHVDNIGYYFALSDYADAQLWADWRSGARPDPGDPGYTRLNGEMNYRWLDRFVGGNLALSQLQNNDGLRQTSVYWRHSQDFSARTHLQSSINYTSSTVLQRQTTYNPLAAISTIRSEANFSTERGPFAINLGGDRTQYPGREQVDLRFPTLQVSSKPVSLGEWLVWTPNLSYSASSTTHEDGAAPTAFRFTPTSGGGVDSVAIFRTSRHRSASFSTPIRLFSFTVSNGFSLEDDERRFPQQETFYAGADSARRDTRVFDRLYLTAIDWQPSIGLPQLGQGRFNISPSVSLSNVAGGSYWVRSPFSGGRFVRQTKRLSYALGASPTVYGLFPGVGAFSRFRHAVNPTVAVSYAPAAAVSDEYLQATGRFRQGSLLGDAQQQISLTLNTNIEGKLRGDTDSTEDNARKIKLLALNADQLAYDFERARRTRRTGLTSENWGLTASSDLLPSFSLRVGYSLFEGDTQSDTARFSPYRTSVNANFTVSNTSNPLGFLGSLFGAVPPAVTDSARTRAAQDPYSAQLASQPVTGSRARNASYAVPDVQGWTASLSFSSQRQRPPRGGKVDTLNVAAVCNPLRTVDTVSFRLCVDQSQVRAPGADPNQGRLFPGSTTYVIPATTNVQSNVSFRVTPKWSMAWQTQYDVENRRFADQIINLQRDLHDWRATFSVVQGVNGLFSFHFFISLKAEPELKFDYDRRSYRSSY
ncbi:MAG: hypothetical protein NVS1B4_07810 [Gemmatimonadaceae bacterium]